jgi:hypothetical protein
VVHHLLVSSSRTSSHLDSDKPQPSRIRPKLHLNRAQTPLSFHSAQAQPTPSRPKRLPPLHLLHQHQVQTKPLRLLHHCHPSAATATKLGFPAAATCFSSSYVLTIFIRLSYIVFCLAFAELLFSQMLPVMALLILKGDPLLYS